MCDNLTNIGYYFASIGWDLITLITGLFAVYSFFTAFPAYWLKWWTDDRGGHMNLYIPVYLALSLGVSLSKNIASGRTGVADAPIHQAILFNVSYITSVTLRSIRTGVCIDSDFDLGFSFSSWAPEPH